MNQPTKASVAVRAPIALLAFAGVATFASTASAEVIYGVTSTQRLVSFDSAAPGAIATNVAINGLQAGETLRGIDFRPLTGGLYGLGSSSRLYMIDPNTGNATAVAGAFTPAITGTHFGFDFNPTIDRIRVVGNDDQNTVLNPLTGGATAATAVFYAAGDPNVGANPNIVGSAYDRNFNGGVTSQLYGIDSNLDILVRQANSAGTLNSVGGLGFDLGSDVGFDIAPGGTGFVTNAAALTSATQLYTVNLMTGQLTSAGLIGGGFTITGIAATPAPGSLALLGAAGLLTRRRR